MTNARTREWLWRASAIALFCGVPVLLVGFAISNLFAIHEATDQAERKRATAATIVAQLEKHRVRKLPPVDTASLYLQSTRDTLARAELQERATKLVEQSGGSLAEAQLVATPEQEAAGTVAIQLSLEIDNKGLLDLLYAIESGLPLFEVTNLDAQKTTSDKNERESDSRQLHVDLTMQAHWRRSAG